MTRDLELKPRKRTRLGEKFARGTARLRGALDKYCTSRNFGTLAYAASFKFSLPG